MMSAPADLMEDPTEVCEAFESPHSACAVDAVNPSSSDMAATPDSKPTLPPSQFMVSDTGTLQNNPVQENTHSFGETIGCPPPEGEDHPTNSSAGQSPVVVKTEEPEVELKTRAVTDKTNKRSALENFAVLNDEARSLTEGNAGICVEIAVHTGGSFCSVMTSLESPVTNIETFFSMSLSQAGDSTNANAHEKSSVLNDDNALPSTSSSSSAKPSDVKKCALPSDRETASASPSPVGTSGRARARMKFALQSSDSVSPSTSSAKTDSDDKSAGPRGHVTASAHVGYRTKASAAKKQRMKEEPSDNQTSQASSPPSATTDASHPDTATTPKAAETNARKSDFHGSSSKRVVRKPLRFGDEVSPSPVLTSGRARARMKFALQSSDSVSPSTSSAKTDSDDKSAGPSGHVTASAHVGHGTKTSAAKKQRMKEEPSDNESSQASLPPSATTDASHPDAVTTPKAAEMNTRKSDCHGSSGKRVVRKPLRFGDEASPSPVGTSGKERAREKFALQSSDSASPSTSSDKTDSDDKSAGPSGHVTASAHVGYGTKASAAKKQRMKEEPSDNQTSQASSPPSATTDASHPDTATTPKVAETNARKSDFHGSSGKRVVRKPLRFGDEASLSPVGTSGRGRAREKFALQSSDSASPSTSSAKTDSDDKSAGPSGHVTASAHVGHGTKTSAAKKQRMNEEPSDNESSQASSPPSATTDASLPDAATTPKAAETNARKSDFHGSSGKRVVRKPLRFGDDVSPSPLGTSDRERAREKFALPSSDSASPSTSSDKTDSDDKSAGPSGHVTASTHVGHGTKASAAKKQWIKEEPSDESSQASLPPSATTDASHPDAVTTPKAAEMNTRKSDCHGSSGKRVVRKPLRFSDEVSPSSVGTSGRKRAHEKFALQSSDSASPSTSSAKTDSDDKSAGPSGHVTASAHVGHGTKTNAAKKQWMKVFRDSESSQASSPPSATTDDSHPDAATTPKAAEPNARKSDCQGSSGKRVSRKPLWFDDEGAPPSKKEKSTDTSRSPALRQNISPVAGGDDVDKVTWCKDCRKRLNPSEVVFFKGDPEGAVEEFVAIIDPRLTSSLCSQDELTEQPQFKITLFTVYDEHGHVCPFDGGLINANVALYLSGHVKSICAEDPGVEDSVAVARAGPIVSWWTTGYDGGANVVLGLTTEYAEYVLMTPSAQYEPCMKRMKEKTYLIRGVLEKLIECGGDASFADVMHHLESLGDLPSGVGPFSLETLHRHSQFVVDHVQAYDFAGDTSKDTPLLDSAFICELMRVTGAFVRDAPEGRTLSSVVRKVTKKLEPKAEFVMPVVCMTLEKLRETTDSSAKKSGLLRKNRCGLCEACLAPECKLCVFCRNMKKYGGPGTFKQCCIRRRCQQRECPDSANCAGTDSMDHEVSRLPDEPFAQREFLKRYGIDCAWTGDVLETTAGKTFYSSCRIGSDLRLSVGDDVTVLSPLYDTKRYVGRVTQLYADSEGKKFAHVIWFRRYEDTVLGNSFADVSGELFSTTECDAVPLAAIGNVCRVIFRGLDCADDDISGLKEHKFFYRFQCHATTCTFIAADVEGPSCACSQQERSAKMFADVSNKKGGCFFVKPDAIRLPLNSKLRDATPEDTSVQGLSGDEFTERYRKSLYPPKKEDCSSPDPYRICCILPDKKRRLMDSPLIVQPFYRDYEVHRGSKDKIRLYLSLTSFPIAHTDVVAPCEVVYSVGAFVGGPFDIVRPSFYFSQCYDAEQDTYTEPGDEAKQIGRDILTSSIRGHVAVKSVDVYCGSGGLSLGLAQSGVAKPVLALSDNEHHLKTFSRNFPLVATLLCPSKVLKDLHAGTVTHCLAGLKRGEIDLVCGSPSFQFKKNSDGAAPMNSQLLTFLGFCEFLDPLYVVLVAERRAVKYHNGSALALALKCLLDLGYQTSCSMLQDGCYGMPQRHRRLVIFGAKRGLTYLPAFPAATHAFDVPERHLSFAVDGRAYASPLVTTSAAPYPRATLRDAIGDLCSRNGAGSVTNHQYFAKRSCEPSNNCCVKKMTPMAQARIALIPTARGSDWRDLPNREVQLSDGTTAYRLVYTHKCSASPYGRQRGVCSCAEDDRAQCDPMYRQENTLIPWSLVHTGHRSGQWSGVYGRLQWDGYLHGVVANPEPLSKQGPVIHPEEDRVLSVRECARIQGYPDDFGFVGPTLELYKMIAESVAPRLALALGREIAKQLPKKLSPVNSNVDNEGTDA